MLRYVIRRLLQGIVVLFGVLLITFALPFFFKGNIARAVNGSKATPAQLQQWLKDHGLTDPFLVQFWHYMSGVLFHLNFGTSYIVQPDQPVWGILSTYFWRTVMLALIPLVLSTLIAIPIGMYQALKRNSFMDHTITTVVFILYSVPAFLLSLMLLNLFGQGEGGFNMFPPGPPQPTAGTPWYVLGFMFSNWQSFFLPVMALTVLSIGGLTRFMRGSVLDALVQDYVRTAKAKGCSSRRVLFRHTMRNAIIPQITILGLSLPALFSGALIIEQVFNYQGLGIITVQAATQRDTPIVMAATFMIAIATIVGNILADVGIALIDPRIRLTGKR